MPVALLRRTAIIALALCLASCVSGSAEQEPRYAPHSGAAGNQQASAPPAQQEAARPLVIHPKTVVCVFPATPHTKAHEQRRPIPPGKQIKDLCPPGAHVALFYDPFPHRSHVPLPDVMIHWTSTGYTLLPTQKPQPATGGKSP
jgi:hypothetical protein